MAKLTGRYIKILQLQLLYIEIASLPNDFIATKINTIHAVTCIIWVKLLHLHGLHSVDDYMHLVVQIDRLAPFEADTALY